MKEAFIPGSDPGLCVAERVTPPIIAFGLRCATSPTGHPIRSPRVNSLSTSGDGRGAPFRVFRARPSASPGKGLSRGDATTAR